MISIEPIVESPTSAPAPPFLLPSLGTFVTGILSFNILVTTLQSSEDEVSNEEILPASEGIKELHEVINYSPLSCEMFSKPSKNFEVAD